MRNMAIWMFLVLMAAVAWASPELIRSSPQTPVVSTELLISGRNVKIARPVIDPAGERQVVAPWHCGRNGVKEGDFVIIEIFTSTPKGTWNTGWLPDGAGARECRDGVAIRTFEGDPGDFLYCRIRIEDKFKAPSNNWKVVARDCSTVLE